MIGPKCRGGTDLRVGTKRWGKGLGVGLGAAGTVNGGGREQDMMGQWDGVWSGQWLPGCHLQCFGNLISSGGCDGLLSGKSQ